MKYFLTCIFLACFASTFGQFAIVTDKDGFLNVRKDGHRGSKVTDKLPYGHLIYCYEDKGNWTNIDYTKKDKELNGYIYHDRYKFISNFSRIPLAAKTQSKVIFKINSIEVSISESNFDKAKHTFTYHKKAPGQITLIDRKQYWGTDGGMPKTQFDKIELKIHQKRIALPQEALEGLYEPNIYSAIVSYDKKSDTFYIQTTNSDGAGSYTVLWRMEKGVYKDRLVAYGF